MAANSLNFFGVKNKSFLSKLGKSKLLIEQAKTEGTDGWLLENMLKKQVQPRKGKATQPTHAKAFIDRFGGFGKLQIDKGVSDAVDEIIRGGVTQKTDQLQRTKNLWQSLGGDPDSLRGILAKDNAKARNIISYILSIPVNNNVDVDGFTEAGGQPLINAVGNIMVLSTEINEALSGPNPIGNVEGGLARFAQDTSSAATSATSSAVESLKSESSATFPPDSLDELMARSSFSSVKLVSQESPESVARSQTSQREATRRAQEDIAHGLPPAQGAGAAASVTSLMSASSESTLRSQQESLAEGPEAQGSLPSRDSLLDVPFSSASQNFNLDIDAGSFGGIFGQADFFEEQRPQRAHFDPSTGPAQGPAPTPGQTPGPAQGPDGEQLDELGRAAQMARLIAQQNGKLAVDILKSLKKPEPELFMSTDRMNDITNERNLTARLLKKESLAQDHRNASRQDRARLAEIQRQYNQMHRVQIAPK